MNNFLLNLYVKSQILMASEEGQDLVEYALVFAMVAFGSTAGMQSLAVAMSNEFSNVSLTLTTNIT